MERKTIPSFYHYLLSYIIVLLIPILLIGLLVYQRFVGILQEEITLGHQHVLEQARSTFEARINEMNKIAIEISSKPELSPDKLNMSMSSALDAMDALRNTAANPFIHHIVYYLKDGSYMYSPDTTYPVSLFAKEAYRYAGWPADQFVQDIRGLTQPLLRPAEQVISKDLNTNRALTYLVPIPYNSPSPYGVLVFLIKEESVNKLLEGTLEERHGNSLVMNSDGQIIAALHHKAFLESPEFKQVVRSVSNGMKIAEFDQESYAISTLKLGHDGWTYVTMLPENDFMKKTGLVQTQFFLAILIVLLVGSALIYALMRLNYKPVQLLGMRLNNAKAAARNHLLLNLLRGRISDIGACNNEGSDVGVVFTKPLYFVALVDLAAEASDTETTDRGSDLLETVYRKHFESYRVDTMDETRSTFICAISQEEEPDWQRLLKSLHSELSELFGNKATMGVGQLYSDISQAGKSYIEAATALDYKLIKGHNTLITYEEIKADNVSASWYPKEEMELLMLYIQQGDSAKVEDILQNLQSHMLKRPIPLHIARCICYDVMGCLIKTHYKLQRPCSEGMNYPDVFSLARFDTMQDLAALVRQMCLLVKETAEFGQDHGNAEQWIAYIRMNYQEHEFSVQRMADHFAVSRSYLNASFKKLTGQTIMDFLDYYRLEKAKELLANSELQLKEVVERIGYYDVSSFIRKFKQKLHMTPGEFRKVQIANRI